MKVLIANNLTLPECQTYNLKSYDEIIILISSIDYQLINYLIENNLNCKCKLLMNNDTLIKDMNLFILINNFKMLYFENKRHLLFIDLDYNILISKLLHKNCIKITYDNSLNLYSNIITYLLQNSNNISNIDLLNTGKIKNSLLDDINEKNIKLTLLNNNINTGVDITTGGNIKDIIGFEDLNHNINFIHITKNAGTFIEDIGFQNNLLLGKYNNSIEKYNTLSQKNNDYYHINPNYFYPEIYNNNFSLSNKVNFLVVRNPYDRILSEIFCPWAGILNFNISPSIEDINQFLNEFLMNPKTFKVEGHYAIQYHYAYDNNDILMVDDILKMETLSNDLKKFNEKYNLNLVINKSSKTNTSTKICSIEDISKENIKLINEIYELDFKTFNYPMIDCDN